MQVVLVVDDDDDTRDALCEVLDERGYTVVGERGGKEALRYLRDHPSTSLVILDLMMPTMDGYEFRRHQLQDAALASIPVLIFSAQHEFGEGLDAAHALHKPIRLEALLGAVERSIRK